MGRPAVFGAADASERASEMFLRTGAFFSSILSEFLKNLVALQVNYRDYNAIQSLILIFSLHFILINLVVDILYALLNPEIKLN